MEISWQLDNVTHSPHTADKWLRATSKQGLDPLRGLLSRWLWPGINRLLSGLGKCAVARQRSPSALPWGCLPSLAGELVQLCQPCEWDVSVVPVGVSCSGFGMWEMLSCLLSVPVPHCCSSQVGQGGGTSYWKCSGDNLLAAVHHEVPFRAGCGHAMPMRFLRDKICKTILGHPVGFVPNCNVLLW